jgi:hypothetical protein
MRRSAWPAPRVVSRAALAIGAIVAAALAAGSSRAEMTIVAATYGANCGARPGNATRFVARACGGRSTCRYRVDGGQLGDPVEGCHKNFEVIWRCPTEEAVRTAVVPPEAGLGSVVTLGCGGPPPARIDVLAVVGPDRTTDDAVTERVLYACNGAATCEIAPTMFGAGDRSAPTPAAAFSIRWRCEGDVNVRQTNASASDATRLSCR